MARRTGVGNWIRFFTLAVIGLVVVVGAYAVAAPWLEFGGVAVPRAELPPSGANPAGMGPRSHERISPQIAGDQDHAPRLAVGPRATRSDGLARRTVR